MSYLLRQGSIRFMVTGALHPDSPIADHVRRHGDGIRDIAFRVDDVDAAYDAALQRGGTGLRPPADDTDEHGTIRHAAIATYGDTVHTLLDRSRYDGPFAPGFEPSDLPVPVGPDGRARSRSTTSSATSSWARSSRWVHFYEQVFGFCQLMHFDDDQISTEYSALMSTVVWSGEAPAHPPRPRPS